MPTDFKRASFDVKASMRIGLENAVFCYWLLGLVGSGGCGCEGAVDIDREAVRNCTSLGADSQLSCQASLRKYGVVRYSDENPDRISFDLEKYLWVIRSDDEEFNKEFRVSPRSKSDARKAKKACVSKALKSYISAEDPDVKRELEHWVDALVDSGKMTKETVIRFQETLNGYAKGSRKVALDVIGMAVASKYSNCVWAIESYEREKMQI